MQVPHVFRNARMSPVGLFETLDYYRDHVIVLDDLPALAKSEESLAILLAATDGDPRHARMLTYTISGTHLEVPFRGGIISISNKPLRRPAGGGMRSRVVIHVHEPDDDMFAAYIRHLADQGCDDLSMQECREVADFVISESRGCSLRLNFRDYFSALGDYHAAKTEVITTDWRELVRRSSWALPQLCQATVARRETRGAVAVGAAASSGVSRRCAEPARPLAAGTQSVL